MEEPLAEMTEERLFGTLHAVESGTVGVGDPDRCRVLPGSRMKGAHSDNPEYFRRQGDVLTLKRVCWLHIGGSIPEVPAGAWEAVLHVKCDTSPPTFVGDWRVGVGVRHVRTWQPSECNETFDTAAQANEEKTGVRPLMFRNLQGLEAYGVTSHGSQLFKDNVNQWIKISFGELRLRSTSDVKFEMGGGNPHWARGLHFGNFELRAVGLSWEQKRLLILCLEGRAGGQSCWLQTLPPVLLTLILSFIHTPLAVAAKNT